MMSARFRRTEGNLMPDQNAAPTPQLEHVHSPVVVAHMEKRAADVQLRVADAITAFAGSMRFVYLHVLIFAIWMIFLEKSPWETLTLIVSLEAIFLSTFVMIGQNRQASFQQAKADRDFVEQEHELKTNTELTRAIHALATQIHGTVCIVPHTTIESATPAKRGPAKKAPARRSAAKA
jgi:uncharacterized membrane protein